MALQCRAIPDTLAGMVLLGEPDRGPFRPAAVWPNRRWDLQYLGPAAERAISERRGLLLPADGAGVARRFAEPGWAVAYPVDAQARLYGVVVLDVATRPEAELQEALRQLHWGIAWLDLLFTREAVAKEAASRERLQTVLDLVASAAGHERFHAAAMAFVTALATQLRCDRVSVGLLQGRAVTVRAVSHSAQFKQQTSLLRAMEAAMDEALDQQATIVYPPSPSFPLITKAHADLARQHDVGAICSIPLTAAGSHVGVLMLERPAERPFDGATRDLCEAVAALAAPLLESLRRDDRWLGAKAWAAMRAQVARLIGPQHVALKLSVFGSAALAAFCVLATGEYRVSAKTVLEPSIKRVVAAPFQGFVADARVRAGDLVTQGQVLCTLDDRDLRLEQLKALSQHGELQKQYHQALAERKAAQVEVLTAQIDQVKAQQALLSEQLARTRMQAPFDGVVVSGDLSQSLGAPVEKGETLFELAPLDAYRVIVQVDERDIADVAVGQEGTVLFSAFPSDPLAVTVTKITPVSEAKEGRNYFRVEGRLHQAPATLRPAMEGVGKISIDERRLVWIWTRQAIDWLRLTVWAWWP
ncbi:MAG: HlyD family efflux transporter periplasmic adaptor subunit [Nitrospirota bacterium]|nr:HlyD family efflux transporter periplasmic adaptor subunit [Nitrospirota bacterium]MDE3243363.1 HlyD family efflux transporter periplasmic adaptor subunit [Nitrospirota bacterium]